MIAGLVDFKKMELPILNELIIAQSTNQDGRTALTSARKPNDSYKMDSDWILLVARS